jgi:hypothetical protein
MKNKINKRIKKLQSLLGKQNPTITNNKYENILQSFIHQGIIKSFKICHNKNILHQDNYFEVILACDKNLQIIFTPAKNSREIFLDDDCASRMHIGIPDKFIKKELVQIIKTGIQKRNHGFFTEEKAIEEIKNCLQNQKGFITVRKSTDSENMKGMDLEIVYKGTLSSGQPIKVPVDIKASLEAQKGSKKEKITRPTLFFNSDLAHNPKLLFEKICSIVRGFYLLNTKYQDGLMLIHQ